MCYDTNKWTDARDAILKSSLAVPKYCKQGPKDNVEVTDEDLENFEIDSIPTYFDDPYLKGEKIHLNKGSLTYKFQLDDTIDCYLQFFIKCKKVYKSAGMGDTISGTGFIYHVPK